MKNLPLATSGSLIGYNNFWSAVFLYNERPQIVNRKLVAASKPYTFLVDYNSSSVKLIELLTHSALLYEVRKLKELNEQIAEDLIKSLLEPYDKNLVVAKVKEEFMKESYDGCFISVRRLIPKQSKHFCLELTLIDKDKNCVSFLAAEDGKHISAPPFPYRLEFASTGHVKLLVDSIEDADSPSADWLVDSFFTKFMKWCENYNESNLTDPSLKLIDVEQYSDLYKLLKDKYGKKMVEIWPENTDPLKFVYEDVAIAAYLISLWSSTSPDKKPSFVDLGCGNGLLVYILNEEGYPGFGIDVRKRKIWDLYPKTVKLVEQTIIPSAEFLFPESDWIIGNHSDELTPWIPVISLRSSPSTNFFLLPCCSYDFNGKKYSRINTSKSQYGEYLDYIENVCKTCGFFIERDKLRIPSTKKTCLVSLKRDENYQEINTKVTALINEKCNGSNRTENWVENYKPREAVEKVRNCTQLDRTFINKMIEKVVGELLKNVQLVDKKDNKEKWNCGNTIALEQLVKSMNVDDLKEMKKECGGLQTLLRNHRYIFQVEKGCVKLRPPPTYQELSKFKEKKCWFFNNHPNGCLHEGNVCAYSHDVK